MRTMSAQHEHIWQTWDEVNDGRGGLFSLPNFSLVIPQDRPWDDVLNEYLRYCSCGRATVLDGPLRRT